MAAEDCSGQLRISGKLYGREQEIEEILTAYKTICQGHKGILMLADYSGTGKTSLVNEIQTPITRDRGFFFRSKFDKYCGGVPYSPFIEVLTQFCNSVLRGEVKLFLYWKDRIINALGNLGKLLTDRAPLLETLLGVQPDVPLAGELEEQ